MRSTVLHVITTIVYCHVVLCVSTRTSRNGGFPKFITQQCGIRNVHWYPNRDPRVIGGEIPPRGAIPWQIDVRIKKNHRCGGVIISEYLIITAAHCLKEEQRKDAFIVAGSFDNKPNPYEQVKKIETIIRHPNFRQNGPYSNDIAILVLKSPIKFGKYVQKICLPPNSIPSGSWCEVSGWGANDPNNLDNISSTLLSAALPILSLETCRKEEIYGDGKQEILDTMLCAGHLRGGVDACGGDSGGPLVCDREGRLELTGIVSWGDGCARSNRPGVYTRVASYVTWIQEVAQKIGVDYN